MSEPSDLRIIRRRELAELLGVSGMTVWRWEAPRGDLPARIRLGPHTVGWRRRDIEAWLAKRGAAEGAASMTALLSPSGDPRPATEPD
jgi:prophage regulatory protein